MKLEEYADTLAVRLQAAISVPIYTGMVQIPAEDACGIAQFLSAQRDNIRDAGRIDDMDRMGAYWTITRGGKVVGSGRIRNAMDSAIRPPMGWLELATTLRDRSRAEAHDAMRRIYRTQMRSAALQYRNETKP